MSAPFQVVETLILASRIPGTAPMRTRMHKALGDAEASRLHAAVFVDHMRMAAAFHARATPQQPRHVSLYVPEATDDALVVELCAVAGARAVLQDGKEAHDILRHATVDELDRGAHVVAALAGMVPALPEHLVEEALRAAQHHDVVLGPTFEGSPWCVALRRDGEDRRREGALLDAVFHGPTWNGPQACNAITRRCAAAGLSVHWLPFWPDLSEDADLSRSRAHLAYQDLRGDPHGAATFAALEKRPPPATLLPRARPDRRA